jgi:alpha-amylase/alpha-mannosidase (GH57 family)
LTDRFLCVHAHFYQPPRENPWLESIESQDSAYPYHDWNERVTAECYAPNSAARILGGDGRIQEILNNYHKISFNFGPTVLSWMQDKDPELYASIQLADRVASVQLSGHGSAIAQAYNHLIMPLANPRDRKTQTRWGIRDFEKRFGRKPEGMWLPEGAVNTDSLEEIASQGIAFTILSPHSAREVRKIGETEWTDVSGGRIDPSMAYRIQLPSGKAMSLFFYDGPTSRAVAFENLLESGEKFANRLLGTFSEGRTWPQLAHIATDGETYGHHKKYGEMALAYALDYVEKEGLAKLTNYAEFLAHHPPAHEVQIYDNSSWSCAHGIERWRSNCGCNSGMHAGWNQEWRAPLREALDWLRGSMAPLYETAGSGLFGDPWKARDEYIDVILDRSHENICAFFKRNCKENLSKQDQTLALTLLEMQRHAMLMYTSCGWFFDELSGLETVQVIQYAGRALQLADGLKLAPPIEPTFLERLARAPSNLPEHRDGKKIYEEFVKPTILDLPKVGAHYAISSLFENFGEKNRIYCYTIEQKDARVLSSGKTKLVAGRINVTSDITWESSEISYGVVHLGDHLITGGVRLFEGEEEYEGTLRAMTEAFENGDFTGLVHTVDNEYGGGSYTLGLLFRDEQRKVMGEILKTAVAEAETAYRQLYENRAPLMHFIAKLNLPSVRSLQVAAEFTLNADIRRAFESENLNPPRIQSLLDEAKRVGVSLDKATLEFSFRRRIEAIADRFRENPSSLATLQELDLAVGIARSTPFDVVLWQVQNIYYGLLRTFYEQVQNKTSQIEGDPEQWLQSFRSLGEKLLFAVN